MEFRNNLDRQTDIKKGGDYKMPNPTCQLNLTLSVPIAELVEKQAFQHNRRPSGYGRELMEERLSLAESGWEIGDSQTFDVISSIVANKSDTSLISAVMSASEAKKKQIRKIIGE